MKPVNRMNHAYSQAPWRVERHWISVSLLIVLGFAMIASFFLMVTSQAAIVGREIQDLREEITKTEHENANLQSNLARLTSKDEIEKRAYALKFRPVEPGELEYMYVPGYVIPKGTLLATTPELQPSPPNTPSEYTQSLLDWLGGLLQTPGRGVR